MLKSKFAKVSFVAIIFIVSSSFVGYGFIMYSTAQAPIEKEPIVVGILDPDYGDTISGEIMIRAMIVRSLPSWEYTISVLLNGTKIKSSVPFEWDSTAEEDGWWNITVRVNDTKGNVGSDEVLVYVDNTPDIVAPKDIVVGILDPDYGETISGVVRIRALVYGTESFSISILLNGIEIATVLPYNWDTTSVSDDWYTITIIITDLDTNNMVSDEVLVYVENNPVIEPFKGIVAVWEDLYCTVYPNTVARAISFDNRIVAKSGYCHLESPYSIVLTQSGWYRFTISFLWTGLDTQRSYELRAWKVAQSYGTVGHAIHHHDSTVPSYSINYVGYIFSDGNDALRFSCVTPYLIDDDGWGITDAQEYNQLGIEYIGE